LVLGPLVLVLCVLAGLFSVGFLIYAIVYPKKGDLFSRHVLNKENSLSGRPRGNGIGTEWADFETTVLKRMNGIERRVTILELLEYANIKLSVALVQQNSRFVLCMLSSGPFNGFWGFPAGYVKFNKENMKDKAEYEVSKYLGGNIRIQYLGQLKKSDEPLTINYGEPITVEVEVHRFALLDEPSKMDPNRIRVIEPKEIEALDPVNPLVFDILHSYMEIAFSNDFVSKINERKEAKIVKLHA
jgi:hypothetical protein